MKRLCLFVVGVLMAMSTYAAVSTLVATLESNGTITNFFGYEAFKNAMTAAVDGDVITLSSGTYASTNITKEVTIRGAGMQANPETGAQPTIIYGNIGISRSFNAEGIKFIGTLQSSWSETKNMTFNFIKCSSSMINCEGVGGSSLHIQNCQFFFLNCRLCGDIRTKSFANNFNFYNTILDTTGSTHKFSGFNDNCMVSFDNCIVKSSLLPTSNLTMTNTIVVPDEGYTLSPTTVANYCLAVGTTNADFWTNVEGSFNNVISDFSIFKTFDGVVIESEDFGLSDTTSYVDEKGNQIGIYGGKWPYDPIIINPRVTKFEVAPKSTADGKLSIDIEVHIPE